MANKKIAETAERNIQNLDDVKNIGILESERRPGRVRQGFAERFRNFLARPQEQRSDASPFGVHELGVEQLEEVCAPAVIPAWPTANVAQNWQGQILKTPGNGTMYDSVVSTSGNYVVMAYQNGTVEIRSAITGAITKSINTGGRANYLAADPMRERVYVSSGTGSASQLQGYDLATGNRVLTINTGKWTNKPSLSDDGSKIEIDLDNDEGTGSAVFDANTGAQISTMPPFSIMGTFIGNETLLSWRWDTHQLLKQDGTGTHVLTTTAPLIYDIPVSPDKTKIALVDRNGTAKIADANTGATLKSFAIETGVESARFLSNTVVAIGLGGGRVDIFDISGNTPVRTQILNAGGQTVMNIQTIGQYLVADAGDRLVTRLQPEILLPAPPPNPIIETINTLPPLVIPAVPQQQKDLAPWLSQQSLAMTARGEQLRTLSSQLDQADAELSITPAQSALLRVKMQGYSDDLITKFGVWQNAKDSLADGLNAIANGSNPNIVDPATLTTQNVNLMSGISARMFVSFPAAPNDQSSTLNIRFRSPYDRTYIEVIDESGQMNHMYMVGNHNEFRQTVEHASGTTDQTIAFGFWRANSGNGGNVTVRMYTDQSKAVLLGEVHGGYLPGINTGWVNAQPSWNSLGSSANFALTELGGHVEMKGWRDRDNLAPELYNLCVAQGYTTMQSRGAITSVDLNSAQHLVTGVSFKAKGGTDSSQLQVMFLRGSKVLIEQTVAGNTTVSLSDLEGITSVLIRDLSVPLGETGSVTLKELSVTGSPEHDQVGAEPLSSATNATIAKSSAQRMDTTWLPLNYPAPPVPYDPNSYNVYKLRKYGASPAIEYIGYKAPNGVFSQLDHGTYEVHGDTWIIYPTGQNLQLGMYTQGGTAYRTDLPVGQNFDFEVIHSTSPTLAEALHGENTNLEIPEIKLMTINQGDTPGWHSGKKLETDNGSPVAIGTIKARAQVTNNGVLPISFTVNVYSGYSSSAGWDTPIATYPGSLGPNESRTLTVPVDMRADSQGRGLVRFVITDSTGKILTQMERTVGAPNNTEKRVATQLANGLWTLAWVPKTSNTPTLTFANLNQEKIAWKQKEITNGRTWVADPAREAEADALFALEMAKNPTAGYAQAEQEHLDGMEDIVSRELYASLDGLLHAAGASNITLPAVESTLFTTENTQMKPGKFAVRTLILNHPSMVNVWIDTGVVVPASGTSSVSGMNVSLRLVNSGVNYPSRKPGNSAESISSVLPAGTYTIFIEDSTTYQSETILNNPQSILTVPLHIEVRPQSTKEIIGRISVEGKSMTMPVSMRIAKFNPVTGQRDENYSAQNFPSLNPTKPVWVISHGMNSTENKASIQELSKAIYSYATQQDEQVYTIDWNEAAHDITNTGLDAPWTDIVGQWAARRLTEAGVAPEQIKGGGHSHGTYVLYAMARELMRINNGRQMNELIALDAAGNIPLWNGYDHTKIDFDAVSSRAISFESSLIADSDFLAGKTDLSFRINSTNTYNPANEHSLGLTTFTEILNHEKLSPGAFSNFLSFSRIENLTPQDIQQYAANAYRAVFEAEIDVNTTEAGQSNDTYLQGHPEVLRYKKPGESNEQVVHFNTFA